MMYPIEHYNYRVGWSAEDQAYVAYISEFPSLAAHGDTLATAVEELQQVVTAVVTDLQAQGEPIPVPLGERNYSGRLNLRMSKDLHRQLAVEAMQQGVSLNQWINRKLSESAV
jgi:predicted HicB family RNase H-like nuclease